MNQKNNPLRIGVFDSGVGGFSSLPFLQHARSPLEIVYYADCELFPFGEKSQAVLYSSLLRAFAYLANQGVDCIFLACHTISIIYEQFLIDSPIPIYPITTAGRKALEKFSKKKILLLGSKSTIHSGYYQKYLESLNISACFEELSAQNLIEAIEKEYSQSYILQLIQEIEAVFETQQMDFLFLGCTHFSLINLLWGERLSKKILDPHAFLMHCLPFIHTSSPTHQNSYEFLNPQFQQKCLQYRASHEPSVFSIR